jgi:CheY-like chemotaxis protein
MDRRYMRVATVKSSSDRTVGLMEDNRQTLEAWKKVVVERGRIVAVAKDQRAVMALAERGVKNFILDCHMGTERDEEGLNAAERLRKNYPDTRVGLLTGRPECLHKAASLHTDYYHLKSGNHKADALHVLTVLLALAAKKTDPPDAQPDVNLASYLRMRRDSVWMKRHRGKYVCFVEGEPVRSHRDKKALYAYVRAKYPTRPRFVTRVSPEKDVEVVDIPSDMDCDDV